MGMDASSLEKSSEIGRGPDGLESRRERGLNEPSGEIIKEIDVGDCGDQLFGFGNYAGALLVAAGGGFL